MKPYLIANEIMPMQAGERHYTLPLHCTLVHWFWLDTSIIDINAMVDMIADIHTKPIRLIPDDEQLFTTPTLSGDMPVCVTTVERMPELIDLHERVTSLLVSMDAEYEKPEYIHEGYRPHITHRAGETVDMGGYVSKNLYLITSERPEYGHVRTVLAKIALAK